jgi:hypothetical protein
MVALASLICLRVFKILSIWSIIPGFKFRNKKAKTFVSPILSQNLYGIWEGRISKIEVQHVGRAQKTLGAKFQLSNSQERGYRRDTNFAYSTGNGVWQTVFFRSNHIIYSKKVLWKSTSFAKTVLHFWFCCTFYSDIIVEIVRDHAHL